MYKLGEETCSSLSEELFEAQTAVKKAPELYNLKPQPRKLSAAPLSQLPALVVQVFAQFLEDLLVVPHRSRATLQGFKDTNLTVGGMGLCYGTVILQTFNT